MTQTNQTGQTVIEIARDNLILLSEAGSRLHGLETPDSDYDRMGIFIEPLEHIVGLRGPLDGVVDRHRADGERSQPGDVETTLYSLRKYLRLAVAGNPTVLLPLFAPDDALLVTSIWGDSLRDMRHSFLSKHAVERFLGYMHNQYERMLGGGKQNRVPNRPELVEKYGYDVKYAAHGLRLAYQGMEIAAGETLTLPMIPEHRERILAVRAGEVPKDDVIKEINQIERWIRNALIGGLCRLPDTADLRLISDWSIHTHLMCWGEER